MCQSCAFAPIGYGSKTRYVPTNYTCISRNNSFAHQTWHCKTILRTSLPSYIIVHTVRMQFTLLCPLYETYLRKILWEMCASMQINPHILPIITTPFIHCTYKAYCWWTYRSHRYTTYPLYEYSTPLLRTLYTSIFYCAQCTHQHSNTAPTAPLSTPLCAIYHQHPCIAHTPRLRTALCAINPPASKYCAHCTRQYSTVRNIPISIQIQRPLQPPVLQCAHSTHQYANSEPIPRLRTALCEIMYP